MIETMIEFLQSNILPLGALGVFLAEFIEEIIVPIPSSVILIGSGFVFLKGGFSLIFLKTLIFTVVIPASFGLTLGSLVIYVLVYKFEKPFLDKFGKWIGVSQKDIDKMNERMNQGKFDEVFIILARFVPAIPSVLIAIFCGLIKMPWKKYFILTLIGAFLRATALALVGWQVGEVYIKYAKVISSIENSVMILVVVGIFIFIVLKLNKTKS